MPHQHIRISRDEPVTDRHRPRRIIPRFEPTNPREFATELKTRLASAQERIVSTDIGGFDERQLLKIVLRAGEMLPDFQSIQGIEIVSQEDKSVVLAFASAEGLRAFEARLTTLARSGSVTRKELLYAIEDFDHWTPDDRKGAALRTHGYPEHQYFMLDLELWPLELTTKREQMLEAFVQWLQQRGIVVLDRLDQPSLVMLRIRSTREHAEVILNHRDVRTLDLPPRFGVSVEMLVADVNQFPVVSTPPTDAPKVAVLDTGLTRSHPLIGPAIGDAQGFVAPARNESDNVPNGHGTFVSGLALYGDIEGCIRAGSFVPSLRLFSGKVFNDNDQEQHEFVEKSIEEAVRYFHEHYQCRVFNLSYGDLNKVYDGRHVRGLAYTLDRLTREIGVLFVVPTGNLDIPANPRENYPDYLLLDGARLLDPAPALNVITVGGVARHTASRASQSYPNHIEEISIAGEWQPAPFTRAGLSIGGAIKPDFVEEAGNAAVGRITGRIQHQGLGILSLNSGFAAGRAFSEDVGTSFAAPIVAHKAAKLAGKFPHSSINILRAVLAVHAKWPEAIQQLLNPYTDSGGQEKVLRLAGYGKVDDSALFDSLDQVVTLYNEERIEHNKHHFYELPVPDEFWSRGRRTRTVSVALAYSPEVRTTRLDYKRTKLRFSIVVAASLDEATSAFTHGRQDSLSERSTNRLISAEERNPATLQMSRWKFRTPLGNGKKLFVVVTRQDANWSTATDELESYALAVVLNDKGNATVNLYSKINILLQARARARVRV